MAPSEEKVLLHRKANIRSGKLRIVGTLSITGSKLSFRPLAGKRRIDISIDSITGMDVVGRLFKKMSIATDERRYIIFLKGAKDAVTLIETIRGNIRA